MRVAYFGYYFTHASEPSVRFRADLSPLLRNFDRFASTNQKLSIRAGDELLVSALMASPFILLVQTRKGEIVKRVQSGNQISVDDLSSMLTASDHLGFGSYLGVFPTHIALGTKLLSPRVTQVSQYVQQILDQLGIDLRFEMEPLLDEFPREKISKLHSVGAIELKMDVRHKLVRSWIEQLSGGGHLGSYDIGSFTVTIKPDVLQTKTKFKDGPKKLLQDIVALGEDGLLDLEARARVAANDAIRDLYLVSKGQLADSIGNVKEVGVSHAMLARQSANRRLQAVLGEFNAKLVDSDAKVVDAVPHLQRLEHLAGESAWTAGATDSADLVPTGGDRSGPGR